MVHVAKSSILRHDDYKSYSKEQLIYNVKTRFSQCYRAFIEIYGGDALLDLLSNVEIKTRNYESLLKEYQTMKDELGPIRAQAVFDAYL